jgi:ribosome modulation factor
MQVVTGVFKSEDTAEIAVNQLRSLGIPDKRIGIVRPGNRPERIEAGVPVTDTEEPGMGKAMGAAVGGAMGAAGGATAGLAIASLAVPGIGPLIAFGMVGAALLATVGAAAGSAVGDNVEENLGEGIPHEDVYLYEDALRHGDSVVIAYVEEGDQADNATKAIHDAGAEDLDALREGWWEELREGERTHYTSAGNDFDRDEASYRRGYQAALHPNRTGKSYSDVEDELRTAYANTVLDRPFQAGYERGLAHRSRAENR